MKHASLPLADEAVTGPERLLHVDPRSGALADHRLEDLPELLRSGDLLVVNDAATLPASLSGTDASGEALELRLAGEEPDGSWRAVLFGSGDWRTPTESRPPPPVLAPGDVLRLGRGLEARVVKRSELSPRLVWIRFDGGRERIWAALYLRGRPIQYAYEQLPAGPRAGADPVRRAPLGIGDALGRPAPPPLLCWRGCEHGVWSSPGSPTPPGSPPPVTRPWTARCRSPSATTFRDRPSPR